MHNIDIKKVRHFLKVSELLSFSRAARELGVSQPGLTKAILQLEKDIGGTLVRREGKNTHLTPLGKEMMPHFRQLELSARRTEEAAKRMVAGEAPNLQIGLMCTIGPTPISSFLTDYQRTNPGLEFVISDVSRSAIAQVLLAGAVDVAIVGAEISDDQRFRYITLYQERMVAACASDHPFAHRAEVSLEDVMGQPYVDRLQCEFRETFLAEAHRRSFEPNIVARSDREEWAQSLVSKGAGIGLVPERSTVLPNLALVPLSEPVLTRTVSVAVPIGREDTETVRAFLNAVRSHDWRT